MEIVKPGTRFEFMKWRAVCGTASAVLCLAAIGSLFWPGLNFGVDFAGGTEVQLHFEGDVTSAELRTELADLGYSNPDVIEVQGQDNAYIIRLSEISNLPADITAQVQAAIEAAVEPEIVSLRVSPGGDRVSVRLDGAADPAALAAALASVDLEVRGDVRRFGPESDHHYEADLVGVADQLIAELRTELGERGPAAADRVEWVGPRAGRQLQVSAFWALLYTLAFIMVYVAFRFDVRFAPGGIIALLHDALVVVLVFALTRREFNLTTIASLLTIIGYSINDTIVVYDRIRENMARHRDMSLKALIDKSLSETLSRTVMTSATTIVSMLAFFIWGTSVIRDIAFALGVGIAIGTYSSLFIAAPITEWMDTRFFAPARASMKAASQARNQRSAARRAESAAG
jgi:preprotein translocase subunit SecF